ncbi:hypothetical protein [Paenibacillus sp. sgz500958]
MAVTSYNIAFNAAGRDKPDLGPEGAFRRSGVTGDTFNQLSGGATRTFGP